MEHGGGGDSRARDDWNRSTEDFLKNISNPTTRGAEDERSWRRGEEASYSTRYHDDRRFDDRFRGGSPERYDARRDRGFSPPYDDYRRRSLEDRVGRREGSWRSRSPPRSRSRSPSSQRYQTEREHELRRLERDTLGASPEVDLRAVLDIGRKAKEAVASGLVRNLKNAAARTLQSQQQQQQQQQQASTFSQPIPQQYPASVSNISYPSSGDAYSGPPAPRHDAGSAESRNKLRAGNYLVATWDAMTDGHAYDGVLSQVGAYLPHGVSYVKQFVDEQIRPEDMERFVVLPGGRMAYRFHKGPVIPIATTELGLKEFLDFLEK